MGISYGEDIKLTKSESVPLIWTHINGWNIAELLIWQISIVVVVDLKNMSASPTLEELVPIFPFKFTGLFQVSHNWVCLDFQEVHFEMEEFDIEWQMECWYDALQFFEGDDTDGEDVSFCGTLEDLDLDNVSPW